MVGPQPFNRSPSLYPNSVHTHLKAKTWVSFMCVCVSVWLASFVDWYGNIVIRMKWCTPWHKWIIPDRSLFAIWLGDENSKWLPPVDRVNTSMFIEGFVMVNIPQCFILYWQLESSWRLSITLKWIRDLRKEYIHVCTVNVICLM